MKTKDKIFLAGHKGLAGSAILRHLKSKKYSNIITISKKKLNLLDQKKVFNFIKKNKPKYVIIAAALAGGIKINRIKKAEFLYENMQIQNNIIHASYIYGVKNLIFLGSSCIYPKNAKQPFKENTLLTGPLEETNEGYAIAKISGVKLCQFYNEQYGVNYKCLMPCNLYGINDKYDVQRSHFFPAIISKVVNAKRKKLREIMLMGTGSAHREIMYADDLGEACLFFLKKKTKHFLINIGSGKTYSIKYYANFLKNKIYKNLQIKFDGNKLMDGTKMKKNSLKISYSYGWTAKTNLTKGFENTYSDYLKKFPQ